MVINSVTPIQEKKGDVKYDEQQEVFSNVDLTSNEMPSNKERKKVMSIKFFLILFIMGIILTCSFLLTAIWLSSFSVSVEQLSDSLLNQQFNSVLSFINHTMTELLVASETAKQQFTLTFTNYEDINSGADLTFKMFISENKFHSGILQTVLLHNLDGYAIGYNMGNTNNNVTQMVFSPHATDIYICMTPKSDISCNPSPLPSFSLPPVDNSIEISTASLNIGNPMITRSYTKTGVQMIFITVINSNTNSSAPLGFNWYLSMELTSDSLTSYLTKTVATQFSGAVSFIIEHGTNYFIASK